MVSTISASHKGKWEGCKNDEVLIKKVQALSNDTISRLHIFLIIMTSHFHNHRALFPRKRADFHRFGRSSDSFLACQPSHKSMARCSGYIVDMQVVELTAAGLSGSCTRFPFDAFGATKSAAKIQKFYISQVFFCANQNSCVYL